MSMDANGLSLCSLIFINGFRFLIVFILKDGYIDLLAVMENSGYFNLIIIKWLQLKSIQFRATYATVLKNIPCNDLVKCNGISRTFKIDINTNEALSPVNNVGLASFFDINDDVNGTVFTKIN